MYLFNDGWPKLIEPIKRKEVDLDERSKQVAKMRLEVVESLHDIGGFDLIIQLIENCSQSYLVGNTVYQSKFSDEALAHALDWLGRAKDDQTFYFSNSFLGRVTSDDVDRAIEIIIQHRGQWSTEIETRFLQTFPLTDRVLELVDDSSVEVQSLFWKELNSFWVLHGRESIAPQIASKLLEHERPGMALQAMGQLFYGSKKENIDPVFLSSILLKIVSAPSVPDGIDHQNTGNNLQKAIELVQDSDDLDLDQIRLIEWGFLSLSDRCYRPRHLVTLAAEDPSFFSKLIRWGYNRDDGEPDSSEKESSKSQISGAYYLLPKLNVIPGSKDGSIDKSELLGWINSVRKQLISDHRVESGDHQIGKLLSRCSDGADGIWPHESVRFVIERAGSEELIRAIASGKLFSGGVTSRHPYSGGKLERNLAAQFVNDAQDIELIYPRTAQLLRSIAQSYECEAEREDRSVEAGW